MGRILVRMKVWKRYVAADSHGVLKESNRPSFDYLAEALSDLQCVRDSWTLIGYDCTGLHILDRCTGAVLDPSPEEIEEFLEAGRCSVCKARWDERCDAGLHG